MKHRDTEEAELIAMPKAAASCCARGALQAAANRLPAILPHPDRLNIELDPGVVVHTSPAVVVEQLMLDLQ